jgi:hypothetical protein
MPGAAARADFTAERQQQVIMGIRNRLLDWRALPRLIRRSRSCIRPSSGVKTI